MTRSRLLCLRFIEVAFRMLPSSYIFRANKTCLNDIALDGNDGTMDAGLPANTVICRSD